MNELYHHGIKGQKWGVRRYQNKDGTLTAAGKKHNGEKIYKNLKKQVRKERSRRDGFSNQWLSGNPIGPASQRLYDDYRMKNKKYKNSREYKDWEKKLDKFEKKWESRDNIDFEKYDREHAQIMAERPKKNFTELRSAVTYSSKGRTYADDFLTKGGKDMSMAMLEDLGYSKENAEYLVRKMIKANRTLGNI